MNVLVQPQPSLFPHQHDANRHSPTRSFPHFQPTMSGRKRKADDDIDVARATAQESSGDAMSVSPINSPAFSHRSISRPMKRVRSVEIAGRPLSLPRLLETLDADSLRTVLQSICEAHPDIGTEVVNTAPRPSVSSALDVLHQYETKLKAAFPFGGNGSDYAYNRVRHALTALIDALIDFTPHYLPPQESQVSTSLNFLDGATKVVHRLPEWDSSAHKHHKDDAYDEISKAWALVISEASKRGGGIQLQYGGWDQKLAKHNEQAGGRMQAAVNALSSNIGWIGSNSASGASGPSANDPADPRSIRNELLSGTYGSNFPVRVGPW